MPAMSRLLMLTVLLATPAVTQALLSELPQDFTNISSKWAWISYSNREVAVLPGQFNRSAFDAPFEGTNTDESVTTENEHLNTTNFIAYDERFFDLIGPDAVVEHVQPLAYQSHESACYNPSTKQLFFVEWGPPGGDNGTHTWQYMLDTQTNELKKITTNPPTVNVHGCVFYNDAMYVVTDGSHNETGYLARIDPVTLERTTLLNNYYQEPFLGFNDLEIDPNGNFWLTDSKSAYGRDLIDYYYPTQPTVYFVNGTTMRPRPVHITTGNANGVTVSSNEQGQVTVYLPDTGVSEFKPVSLKNPYGNRALWAYDASPDGGFLRNGRFLNNPISYFYDGIRASRNGYLFAGAGDGLDVIDSRDGLTLGSIRVGGGENLAVTVAFGEHELWIVGRGGVWHVSGIKERLDRTW